MDTRIKRLRNGIGGHNQIMPRSLDGRPERTFFEKRWDDPDPIALEAFAASDPEDFSEGGDEEGSGIGSSVEPASPDACLAPAPSDENQEAGDNSLASPDQCLESSELAWTEWLADQIINTIALIGHLHGLTPGIAFIKHAIEAVQYVEAADSPDGGIGVQVPLYQGPGFQLSLTVAFQDTNTEDQPGLTLSLVPGAGPSVGLNPISSQEPSSREANCENTPASDQEAYPESLTATDIHVIVKRRKSVAVIVTAPRLLGQDTAQDLHSALTGLADEISRKGSRGPEAIFVVDPISEACIWMLLPSAEGHGWEIYTRARDGARISLELRKISTPSWSRSRKQA